MLLELRHPCPSAYDRQQYTAFPCRDLNRSWGAIVEKVDKVDNIIRMINIIAAYQLEQTNNTLTHIHSGQLAW